MNRINLWHVMGGIVLIGILASLIPGQGGVRGMVADLHAAWLLDQARKHLHRDRWEAGEKTLQQAWACQPHHPRVHNHVARLLVEVLIARRKWGPAERVLKQALAYRPQEAEFRSQAVNLLVSVLQHQKKWVECVALIETSLDQGGGPDGPLRLALASCYERLQDHRRAEKIYEDNLRRHPEDASAYNDLAYHYAQRGVRLDRALELVKRALEKDPSSGSIIDTLGWIYYRKGWLRQAEIELLQAVQLTPLENRAEVLFHLGVVYAEQGDHRRAVQSLSQALQLQPDFPEAAELLKKEQRPRRSGDEVNVKRPPGAFPGRKTETLEET